MADDYNTWPVLEHSRKKETGIIRRNWTRHEAVSKNSQVVVADPQSLNL